MAELPGWDRSRLGTAATADVEAARVLVYARVLEPVLSIPVDVQLEVLEAEGITDARRRKRKADALRSKRRATLLSLRADQQRYRTLLELDASDDAELETDEPEAVT